MNTVVCPFSVLGPGTVCHECHPALIGQMPLDGIVCGARTLRERPYKHYVCDRIMEGY